MRKFFFLLALLFGSYSQANCNQPKIDMSKVAPSYFNDTDFISVQGSNLISSDKKEYFIKGIAFGNQVWSYVTKAPKFHHTKESYKEIAQMGFNTVRFYINYQLFESAYEPGKYKNEGFSWLNKNIEWAKEAGIKLIVNMHVPQGGFQSNGDGLALFNNRENQTRLINLWREIARYYKDCSTIIGWGLVNEPNVPFNTDSKTSLNSWNKLANEITNAIRQVDSNHVIFAECAISIIEMKEGKKTYHSFNQEDAFPTINDKNVVYEFHSYNPLTFTHQGASWLDNLKNVETKYPNTTDVTINYKKWLTEKQTRIQETKQGFSKNWQEYTFTLSDCSNTNADIFTAAIKPSYLGQNGCIYIDDVEIFQKSNQNQTLICQYNFDNELLWTFGSNDNSGKVSYITTDGFNKKGCLKVQGTKSWAWLAAPKQIPLDKNCEYIIKFRIKTENQLSDCKASFGVDLASAEIKNGFCKSDIQEFVTNVTTPFIQKKVPIFVGEFGCIRNCFEKNLGANEYITDSIEIFKEKTCGYNYHTYHEYSFGLHYGDPSYQYPSNKDLNTELKDLFIRLQK